MNEEYRHRRHVGGIEATAWAWEIDLPPTEKLALLYMADTHRDPFPIDRAKMSRFIGIPAHELNDALRALAAKGWIEWVDSNVAVICIVP